MNPHCLLLLFVLARVPAIAGEPWALHIIDRSSQGADGVRMLDVNDDGHMDIATGWEEGGVVRAYLHPGYPQTKALWPAVTVGRVKSPEDAVFVDLDADGAGDVVSACEGKTKTIYIHWAPTDPARYLDADAWKTEALPATAGQQMWMYTLPLQIDGQHGIDLLVGSKGDNGSVGWLQAPANPRDLAAWTWHPIQDAGWIMSLIATDLDQDGDQDVLISDRKGPQRGIYWLEFPHWTRHPIGGAEREILFISEGDLDQDGQTDVIGIDKTHIVWFRRQADSWTEFTIALPHGVGSGKSAVVCDVDSDGKNDLVFSCENAHGERSGLRWLSWEQSPTAPVWNSHEIAGPAGVKYDRIELYDVDGDGDPDVLCCEERDQLGVFWYENPMGAVKKDR